MRAAVALLSAALTSAVAVAACSPSSRSEPAGEGAEDSGAGRTFGGARPTKVRVPAGYDAKKPAPLLVMLHGYGTAGSLLDFYIKMSHRGANEGPGAEARTRSFPAGTASGSRSEIEPRLFAFQKVIAGCIVRTRQRVEGRNACGCGGKHLGSCLQIRVHVRLFSQAAKSSSSA